MTHKPFSVAQINRYIKSLLEDDALLSELWVEGEISNFKHHSSGHMYFTLKDTGAALSAVMFAGQAAGLAFEPANGMQVVVAGYVSLYEKTGQYQLYAQYMQPAGQGPLEAAFTQLRDALQAEGLFDAAHKKPLPAAVRCVALVTSPTGAAVQDMIKVAQARNPAVKLLLVPTLVQGEGAAESIAQAIADANAYSPLALPPDVLIVGRGGGSMEDLWAFNEEVVARAIAASRLPVISAVGHETDVTIADFAADLRAPTPSAAAAAAVPEASTLAAQANALRQRADRAVRSLLATGRVRLQVAKELQRNLQVRLRNRKTDVANLGALLESLSPYALWKRGYATVCSAEGAQLGSAKALSPGQRLTLHMQDGQADTEVLEVRHDI